MVLSRSQHDALNAAVPFPRRDDGLDVLVLTPWFPNVPNGWPGRFVSDSCIALAEVGVRVRCIVTRGYAPAFLGDRVPSEHRGHIERAQFPGIEELELVRHLVLPGQRFRPLSNLALDRAVDRALRKMIARSGCPDIVLAHTEGIVPGTLLACQDMCLPVVGVLHGENTNRSYLAQGKQTARFRAALSSLDRLLLTGEPLRAYATQLAGRSDHLDVLWNGVDLPAEGRKIPDPDCEALKLVTVGNLQEGKGHDDLLKALSRLDKQDLGYWSLEVLGDGPERARLEKLTHAMGLADKVHFRGFSQKDTVTQTLAKSDIFVLPSYREAFGIVYLEAMAANLLTIGVEGQGPSQFIDDGETGFLVPPRDDATLAELLKRLMNGPREPWRAVAAKGYTFASEYCTWTTHGWKLVRHLGETIAQRKAR